MLLLDGLDDLGLKTDHFVVVERAFGRLKAQSEAQALFAFRNVLALIDVKHGEFVQ